MDVSDKRICYDCVGEAFLKKDIKASGKSGKCSYCHKTRKSLSIEEFADKIDVVFQEFYFKTPEYDEFAHGYFERDGYPVVDKIMETAEVSDVLANDIREVLYGKHYDHDAAEMSEEMEFDEKSYYADKERSAEYWHSQWSIFEHSLKTEARFFNSKMEEYLRSVFKDIGTMATHDGKPIVIDAGPNRELFEVYRGRVFQSDKKMIEALYYPDKELGPPPPHFAKAGRMSSHGISVFYGATNLEIALAEVRPPVGSKVVTAKFSLIRSLRLLDLHALDSLLANGSYFDPDFAFNLDRIVFLRNLSTLMTKPVMPDDEASEYLPTQAIADFLSMAFDIKFDGIIYKSIQSSELGMNIILFHSASRVENREVQKGTGFSLNYPSDGEYFEPDYTVIEISPESKSNTDEEDLLDNGSLAAGHSIDNPSMKIDIESIMVHHIQKVKVEAKKHSVRRFNLGDIKDDTSFFD